MQMILLEYLLNDFSTVFTTLPRRTKTSQPVRTRTSQEPQIKLHQWLFFYLNIFIKGGQSNEGAS